MIERTYPESFATNIPHPNLCWKHIVCFGNAKVILPLIQTPNSKSLTIKRYTIEVSITWTFSQKKGLIYSFTFLVYYVWLSHWLVYISMGSTFFWHLCLHESISCLWWDIYYGFILLLSIVYVGFLVNYRNV